jgi:predicted transposase/invertase (TIGR01784 family)
MAKNIAGNASVKKHPKFAQLTLDFTFKKAFAEEQCQELLISLLEAFLGKYLPAKIKEVQLLPTEQRNVSKKGRAAVFDLHCTDDNGNRFIVEMQLAKQDHFIGRILFYISQAMMKLAKKGTDCKFDLPRIYSLNFLNYEPDFKFRIESTDVVRHIGLSDLDNPKSRYNHIHLALVILTRFNKASEHCKTIQDKWLYLFRNLHKLKKIPAGFGGNMFKFLFEIAEISNFTESELREYEASMKALDDYWAGIDYAKKEAKREGWLEGEASGIAITAKSMLADGLSPARIARITGLPKKQILAMR